MYMGIVRCWKTCQKASVSIEFQYNLGKVNTTVVYHNLDKHQRNGKLILCFLGLHKISRFSPTFFLEVKGALYRADIYVRIGGEVKVCLLVTLNLKSVEFPLHKYGIA